MYYNRNVASVMVLPEMCDNKVINVLNGALLQ